MRTSAMRLLVCSVAILLSNCGSTGDGSSEGVTVGGEVPDFSLRTLDGRTISSRSFKGNAVILTFWATWCQPCLTEIPMLKELQASSSAKVIAIALDEGASKVVKPFVERNAINYQVLIGNQDVFERYQGYGIPYTLVVDRSLRVVRVYRGPVSRESLDYDLKRINGNTSP